MPPNTRLVRPLHNGQVTVPVVFRRALRLDEASMWQITLENDAVCIRAYAPDRLETGSVWLRGLFELFEPVRGTSVYSTGAEINTLIDRSIAALRGKHVSRRP